MKTKFNFLILPILLCLLTLPRVILADDLSDGLATENIHLSETNLPKAGIVIEAIHGQILWEKEADVPIKVAELSNLMTVYLTLQAIKQGTISLDTTISATPNHEAISSLDIANTPVYTGVNYPVKDLLRLALIRSSNVATLMLSNVLDESATDFIKKMNDQAKSFGMNRTTFHTATGIPASEFSGYYEIDSADSTQGNETTVKDLALLSYHLVNDFPHAVDFSREKNFTVLPDSLYEEKVDNQNESLNGGPQTLKGVDGLKIGVDSSGYQAILTSKQKGLRVISVVSGVGEPGNEESRQALFTVSNYLITRAYEQFEYRELLAAGEQKVKDQQIDVEKDFYGVIKKDTTPEFETSNGQISWTNHLPVISDKTAPMTVSYSQTQENQPDDVRHPVVAFLLSVIKVTKLTIVASGTFLFGMIVFLMSFFLPPSVKKERTSETTQTRLTNNPISPLNVKFYTRWIGAGIAVLALILLLVQAIL